MQLTTIYHGSNPQRFACKEGNNGGGDREEEEEE